MMDTLLALGIICVVFFTSILSGILGMAGGMILMGTLTWMLPVQPAMIIHAISQFFANGSRALAHRQYIYRRTLILYFWGIATTFAIFALFAIMAGKIVVFLLMGLSPFIAIALPKGMKLNFTRPAHAFACGLLTTAFQLTAGVGGPLLDIFFQNRSLTRHETVATKAFTQTIAHTVKFIYFTVVVSTLSQAFAGIPLWLCLALIPTAVCGTHLGKIALEKLTDIQFYRATQTILLVLGVIYLLKAAMLMQ